MIRIRSGLIKEYSENGFDKWNSIYKKERNWKLLNTSDIFKFCVKHFKNVVEAMFFVFYLICEHSRNLKAIYTNDPS